MDIWEKRLSATWHRKRKCLRVECALENCEQRRDNSLRLLYAEETARKVVGGGQGWKELGNSCRGR